LWTGLLPLDRIDIGQSIERPDSRGHRHFSACTATNNPGPRNYLGLAREQLTPPFNASFCTSDKWNIAGEHGVLHITWGNYQPRQKTPAELATERRRTLVEKFGAGDIDDLIALAAKCKKKVKLIPPAPRHDDDIPEPAPAFVGPCQLHVQHWKARRAAKAAGVVIEKDDGPHVSEREKKLAAARAYNKARYKPRRKRTKQC
jgi:hypothetical protein